MPADELERELKALIVEVLNLEDIEPDEIASEEQLFGEGLGLDSIDALELGVALRTRYGIKIDSVSEEVRSSFSTVRNLAEFVARWRDAKQT